MITTLAGLALSLSLTAAETKTTAAVSNEANSKISLTGTAKSMLSILEENQRLRHEMQILHNEVDELKSTVAYANAMAATLAKLQEEKLADSVADKEAEIAYDNLMSSVLGQLEQQKEADKNEDDNARNNFNTMMLGLLVQLKNGNR